jgi:hypothetical protein
VSTQRNTTAHALLLAVAFAAVLAVIPTAGQARSSAQTVTANETNFKITLSARPRAGTVIFVAKNAAPIVHDLWVRGGGKTWHTKLIQPRKSAKLRTALKKGVRYRVWCAVDSHAELGMNLLVVAR